MSEIEEQHMNILNGGINFNKFPCFKDSPNARDFIRSCLEKDPTKRSSAGELITHPWITSLTKEPVSSWFSKKPECLVRLDQMNETLLINLARYSKCANQNW